MTHRGRAKEELHEDTVVFHYALNAKICWLIAPQIDFVCVCELIFLYNTYVGSAYYVLSTLFSH